MTTLDLSGNLLRAAAETLAEWPDDAAALEAATGLPAQALPQVRAALQAAIGKLDRVLKVAIHTEPTGFGTMVDGFECVLDLAEPSPTRHGKKKAPMPELVRVVRKGEKALPAGLSEPAAEAKPNWPSSPAKKDLPIGRGLFSSAGRRESPRPGVAPVSIPPRPDHHPITEPRPEARPHFAKPGAGNFGSKSGRFGAPKPAGAKFGGRPGGAKFGGKPGGAKFGGKPGGAKFGGKPGGAKFGGKPGFSKPGGARPGGKPSGPRSGPPRGGPKR